MHPHVTVVGSVNQDLTVQVDEFPEPGETTLGGDLIKGLGGKGANQAVAAARLGAQTIFVGAVGDDGAEVLAVLQEAGVDTSHAVTIDSAKTGSALIILNRDSENTIVVSPAANSQLTPPPPAGSFTGGSPCGAVASTRDQ